MTSLPFVIVAAGLLVGAACDKDNGKTNGRGGAGGVAGSGGTAAGHGGAVAGSGGAVAGSGGAVAGSGGAVAGNGGISGSTGGGGITACPATRPTSPITCSGTFLCRYQAFCNCRGCCDAYWSCQNGSFIQSAFDDGCVQGPPCPDGGAGTSGAGTGGAGGVSGNCPATRPNTGAACTGTATCNYDDTCRCGVCCYSSYRCANGGFSYLGNNDGCLQVSCASDAGVSNDAGSAAVCTFGADQTCNDNPAWSSIHERCTDAGSCLCGDAGTNPDSGRCL
jgi:hypothetical protein